MSDRERDDDGRAQSEASYDGQAGARPRPSGRRELRWPLFGAVALAGVLLAGAQQLQAAVAPIARITEAAQLAHTKGSPSAPVTITEWGDYQ